RTAAGPVLSPVGCTAVSPSRRPAGAAPDSPCAQQENHDSGVRAVVEVAPSDGVFAGKRKSRVEKSGLHAASRDDRVASADSEMAAIAGVHVLDVQEHRK